MSSPNYPGGPVLPKVYTASTASAMQDIDPEDYAQADNAEVHGSAELVRNIFFSSIYAMVEEIPIIGGAIGDIIEILTGVEDGDLNDLGTWVSNLGDFIDSFIAAALHALADLLDFIPFIGGGLSDVIEGIADGINGVQETAVVAQEQAVAAASKVNFTEVYNFETQSVRDRYPPTTADGFTYLEDPAIAASGTWVLRLTPPAGYSGQASMALSQRVDVAAGEALYVEWKQRRYGTPNFRAAVLLYFFDATDTYLSRANTSAVPPIAAPVNEWVTYAAQITPPAGAVRAEVRAVLYEDAGITPTAASGWYFEDVVSGRMVAQAGVKGLEQDLATTRGIALAADAAVAGQEEVVSDHENRITYLESGNQVAEFAVNGTWTKPALSYHKPILIGGGGGGCGGHTSAAVGRPYGGAPGGWAEQVFTSAELPATVPVIAGVGGLGGARRNGPTPNYGSPGTATTFGSYLSAGGGQGGDNNTAPLPGTGTRTDHQPFGGRGANQSGNGDDGQNGFLSQGGAGGTGNGGRGQAGVSPPPGQRGNGSGGGGGAGNGGNGGDGRGGDGGYPGAGGGGAGGAVPWIGPELGGQGGKGGNGKAWVVSSPGILT